MDEKRWKEQRRNEEHVRKKTINDEWREIRRNGKEQVGNNVRMRWRRRAYERKKERREVKWKTAEKKNRQKSNFAEKKKERKPKSC